MNHTLSAPGWGPLNLVGSGKQASFPNKDNMVKARCLKSFAPCVRKQQQLTCNKYTTIQAGVANISYPSDSHVNTPRCFRFKLIFGIFSLGIQWQSIPGHKFLAKALIFAAPLDLCTPRSSSHLANGCDLTYLWKLTGLTQHCCSAHLIFPITCA